MNIVELQDKTIKWLSEVEQRDNFIPGLTVEKTVERSYNVSRTLAEYFNKFPLLQIYLKDNLNLLEIGSGKGIAFNEMCSQYLLRATATNIQPSALKGSIYAVASKLPFNDFSFDIVISVHSITWEPNQIKSIQETLRVLKPNGMAFINLFKFSEITSMWFGNSFWNEFSINEYKERYEFNEINIPPKFIYDFRKEIVTEDSNCLTENYFITLRKPIS